METVKRREADTWPSTAAPRADTSCTCDYIDIYIKKTKTKTNQTNKQTEITRKRKQYQNIKKKVDENLDGFHEVLTK